MKQAHRFSGPGKPYEGLTKIGGKGPVWTGKIKLVEEALQEPLRWRKPARIFVNSMSDLFHEDVPDTFIAMVWDVINRTQFRHTYQILTKRPQRMMEWVKKYASDFISPALWLGVSVEDKAHKVRIDALRDTPTAVRFLSIEPLLEDLGEIDLTGIHWVIVGGESGPNARSLHPDWVRSLRDQCQSAGVPFFFKQWGQYWPGEKGRLYRESTIDWADGQPMVRIGKKAAGRLLDGRTWDEFPVYSGDV